jgi:hypothetical protein
VWFRRRRDEQPPRPVEVDPGSLEAAEHNPELLAAEAAVDRLPSFTPLINPPIEAPPDSD